MDFPGGSDGKESACNVGDLDSIPGLGWFPGEGKGYPFQYSGLENSMDCVSLWDKKEQRQREEPVCACLVTLLCLTVCNPMDCSPPGSCVHGDSLGKNTGVGSLSLLQGIFPTQGWNPGLPHCRQILYRLSHQGNCLKGLPLVKSRTILTTRIMGLHEYILIQIKPWTFGKKEDI